MTRKTPPRSKRKPAKTPANGQPLLVAVRVQGQVEMFEFKNEKGRNDFLEDCKRLGVETVKTA